MKSFWNLLSKKVTNIDENKKSTWPKKREKVLINDKHDPWNGFCVTVINRNNDWVSCSYGTQVRSINVKVLSRKGYGHKRKNNLFAS